MPIMNQFGPTSTPISLWPFPSTLLELKDGILRIVWGVVPVWDPLLLPTVATVPAGDDKDDFFEGIDPGGNWGLCTDWVLILEVCTSESIFWTAWGDSTPTGIKVIT